MGRDSLCHRIAFNILCRDHLCHRKGAGREHYPLQWKITDYQREDTNITVERFYAEQKQSHSENLCHCPLKQECFVVQFCIDMKSLFLVTLQILNTDI